MKSEGKGEEIGTLFRYFLGAIVVISGLMVLYHLGLQLWLGDSVEAKSSFGDQFGALNAWITGVAFFGLMLSVAIQSRDLRSQTRALELQQEALQLQITEFKEQKEELRRTAEAQERANNLAELGLRADVIKQRIAFDLTKMQAAGKLGGLAYENPQRRVTDLLQKLDLLVNGNRSQSAGQVDV